MDAVETAIRNALERGDAFDPSYRERVYTSAFAVLERSIEARPDLPADAAERRRDHLKAKIRSIETEFAPAEAQAGVPDHGPAAPRDIIGAPDPEVTPDPEPRSALSPLRQAAPAPAPRQPVRHEPSFTPQPAAGSAAPTSEHDLGPLLTEEDLLLDDETVSVVPTPSTGPEFEPLGERRDHPPLGERHDHTRARRRRRTVPLVAGLVVAAAAIAALWGLLGSNVLGVSNLQTESAATAPASASGQDAAGEDGNWIIVFTPSDPTRAIATGGAKAEIVTHGDDSFLRISSPDADQPVSFQVGQGILEQLAGNEAVFDIVARAEDGQKTQIAVSCDLASLGECGRSRFEVSATISDFLVRTTLEDGSPSGAGTISIVPDVTGSGKALEILRIRASVAGR